jgi:hypothetical protein
VLQCTEVELLRIRYRSRHETLGHEQISAEALASLRERMRVNTQADQMCVTARAAQHSTAALHACSVRRA